MLRNQPRHARAFPAALLASTLPFAALACNSPVGVEEVGFEPVYYEARRNVLDTQSLSEHTRQLLEYVQLDEVYRDHPDEAVDQLTRMARMERLRSLHVTLAELHYDIALDTGERGRFMAAAVHAYIYLFDDDYPETPNRFSQRFRLACDIYNRGLAQALRGPDGQVLLEDIDLRTPIGTVAIRCTRPGFPWDEEDFSTFYPADAYEIRGLRERIRAEGLGMPLIAVQSGTRTAALAAEHVGREVKLPATAFLRLRGGQEELDIGRIPANLELYLGTDDPSVLVGKQEVPLETDHTAPLAYMLEDSTLWAFEWKGFFGLSSDYKSGVFMLEPYQEDKIPLVLIHGTASSPAAWAQTINGLLADSRIRRRYQIWLALYNTGNPIAYSAAVVRNALDQMVEELDPEGDDAALSRMVLVGHSQGGLVARLLVSRSGNETWNAFSKTPFDEYPLDDEVRELLARCLFFEPRPYVERVIFVSTPHGGSYFALGVVGKLTRKLVRLPGDLVKGVDAMLSKHRLRSELRRAPTSVENMEPESIFVQRLELMPFSEDVKLNSIIAVRPGQEPIEDGNDGIVAYSGAHLEEAETELVVRRSHSCQDKPEVIVEVRRILFEHLGVDRTALEPVSP